MRIERVVLEHHGDVALARRHVVHDLAVDDDFASGHRFEPGDHSKNCALAAAGRSDEHDELAVGDLEVDAVDDLNVAVLLDQIFDDDMRHASALHRAGRQRADDQPLQKQKDDHGRNDRQHARGGERLRRGLSCTCPGN